MKDDIWENRSRKAKEKPRVENDEAKSSLKCLPTEPQGGNMAREE